MPELQEKQTSAPTSLVLKHFPKEVTYDQREELLKMFGATAVKCMADEGRMKYMAFATFHNHEQTKYALSRLHMFEINGRRLVVEYTKTADQRHLPHESDFPRFKRNQVEDVKPKMSEKELLKQEMEEFSRSIHGVAPSLGLDYLPSPLLRYKYPDPTPSIITNISHALIAVPKFYTQVLHLMNKMNLPAPFGPLTPAPPFPPTSVCATVPPTPAVPEELKDSLEVKEMEVTSSEEESELESDEEDRKQRKTELVAPVKRRLQQPKSKKKRCKLQQLLVPVPTAAPKTDPEDVFDSHAQVDAQKKILFNIKPTLHTEQKDTDAISTQKPDVDDGGFGILAPNLIDSSSSNVGEPDGETCNVSNFISLDELRRKRISHREMRALSVFKNYDPGEPTFRLYVKNLAKQVDEKDLRFIFGRFIDWDSESDKNMFDIRLMKEGRMKGQAFVTLAQEKQAIEAVTETNGFVLHTKPLVVQFARSAKPKENPRKPQTKV